MFHVTAPGRNLKISPCGGSRSIKKCYYLRIEGKYDVFDSDLNEVVYNISFHVQRTVTVQSRKALSPATPHVFTSP